MPIALFILLLIGGGTGIAAENSLPGDVFYPIKIHVNETLESALAVTAKGDAEVSVRQAAERLSEAEKLKEKGELTSEQSVAIKNSFLTEVGLMNKNLQKIKEKGDSKSVEEINGEFESEINEHRDIFLLIGGNGTTSVQSSDNLRVRIDIGEKEDDDSRSQIVGGKNNFEREDGDDDEEEDDDDGPKPLPPVQVKTQPVPSTIVTKYTLVQVALHNKSSDCWSVVSGGVYNLTSWISQHPGGASAIISLCGIDGTAGFTAQHGGQGNPAAELASLKIGVLQQ